MAFQAPIAVKSLSSATSELWPPVKSSLFIRWEILRKPRLPGHTSRVAGRGFAAVASLKPEATDLTNKLHNKGLRSTSPFPSSTPTFNRTLRPYSILPPFRLPRNAPTVQSLLPSNLQRRTLFGGSSSQNLLAHMEQTANNNPTSATAQNAFYSALLRADMPAILVERFQSGRYASNPACEATYHRALEKLARTEGASALAGATQLQGRSNMPTEQLQAIGQAVAAQIKGGQVAGAKVGSTGTGDKASPLYVVVEESYGSTIFKWAKFFAYFGFTLYFLFIVLQLVVETSGVLKKVTGSGANEALPQHQTVRFSDVHGCDEAKEELQELVEFLRNPEKFNTLGGKLPKGILLTGPPGTGKTLLARAIAGEAGVPFFFMSGAEFDEIYVGVGAKRVRELFANARSKAPAIIFIDELDALGGKRNERDPAYVKQSLNQLLTELDGFSQDTGVIIVAATNFPQLLDKALTRPGRFDRNVAVPLPDVRGRMAILKHHMKNVQIASDVDESILARGTTGFSGAELENLVNQAAVRASRMKAQTVGMLDFEWAKDKIMMGAERRSAVIQEKDKIMTAYHEAGHALVAMYTRGAIPLYKATIMPRGHALGMTMSMHEMDKVSWAKNEFKAQIDVAMGGKVAEQIIYGEDNVTSGCSADIQGATQVAYQMVTQNGMSDTMGNIDLATNFEYLSSETKQQIESEVRRFIEEGRQRATTLLTERKNELDLLAKALVEYEVLDLEEMKKVLKGEKLQKIASAAKAPMKLPEIVLPPGMGGGSGAGTGSAREGVSERDNEGSGGAGGAKV